MTEGQKKPHCFKSITRITMLKLGSVIKLGTLPDKNPKNVFIQWNISWFLLISAFFRRKSANFTISWNTDVNCILKHNFNLCFNSLRNYFNKHGCNFLTSAKMATLGLLEGITYVHVVTNKLPSRYSNYIIDIFMSWKFHNSNTSLRAVIITSTL